MRPKWYTLLGVAAAAGVIQVSLAALAFFVVPAHARRAASPGVLSTADRRVELCLPDGWLARPRAGDGAAKVRACHPRKGLWVVVIEEPKDLGTLEHYAAAVRGRYEKGAALRDVRQSEPEKVMVNGRPALRRDLEGTAASNGTLSKQLITVIDSGARFTQVEAWCLRSAYEANMNELALVSDAVREVAPPRTGASR